VIFLGPPKTVCFESKNELLDELTFPIIILDIGKKILLLIESMKPPYEITPKILKV